MPRFEHWTTGVGETFIPDTPDKEQVLSVDRAMCEEDGLPPPKLCCVIEAKDWTEAMTKYHEHMGWGPYRPPPGAKP